MGLSLSRWQTDVAALEDLRFSWGDRLDLVDGRLQLEKGKHYTYFPKIILSKPLDVADYLEILIDKTAKD